MRRDSEVQYPKAEGNPKKSEDAPRLTDGREELFAQYLC